MSENNSRARLRVTISDVATAAGVSRATATRALKGEGRYSEETRARILAVCEELGYVPNTMASELAAGRTGTVGLMLRDASNPAYGLLFSRLQEEAHERELDLVTVTIGADRAGAKQVHALHRLLGMRVAGLIVATGSIESEQLAPFADQVPILRVGRSDDGARIHAVAYDDEAHGRMLAAHVLALGHRRIALLDTEATASFPEHVRARAMRRELETAGADVTRVVVAAAPDDGVTEVIALARAGRVSAVMCPSDYRQLAVLRAASAAGIEVPAALGVTGCDGILPGADLMGLTTVRIPVEDVAAAAVTAMSGLLERVASAPIRATYTGRLINGRTIERAS